jgi:hypothetical protein
MLLHENTAAEKIQSVINSMLEMRTKEKERMESENLALGEVTTINLTVMKVCIHITLKIFFLGSLCC